MNRLELVDKLRQKCGGPSTITTTLGQTGEAKDFVDWIDEVWNNLQAQEQNWQWMRKDFSFQTASGVIAYLPATMSTPVTDLGRWREEDELFWKAYKTATGRSDECFLVPWDYDSWKGSYDFGTQSTILAKPTVYAVRPEDNAIVLGSTPDAIYTVAGRYQRAPTAMAADADTPGMPARFHMLIVYLAMKAYASFESAPEVYQEGQTESNKMLAALRIDQLDEPYLGPPLA